MFAKLFNIERDNKTLQILVKIDNDGDKPKIAIEFETDLEAYQMFKLTFGPFPNTEEGRSDIEEVFNNANESKIQLLVNDTIDLLTTDADISNAVQRALEVS